MPKYWKDSTLIMLPLWKLKKELKYTMAQNSKILKYTKKLFLFHPHWSHIRKIMSSGASFPPKPLDNTYAKRIYNFYKTRRNHKSASKLKIRVRQSNFRRS